MNSAISDMLSLINPDNFGLLLFAFLFLSGAFLVALLAHTLILHCLNLAHYLILGWISYIGFVAAIIARPIERGWASQKNKKIKGERPESEISVSPKKFNA